MYRILYVLGLTLLLSFSAYAEEFAPPLVQFKTNSAQNYPYITNIKELSFIADDDNYLLQIPGKGKLVLLTQNPDKIIISATGNDPTTQVEIYLKRSANGIEETLAKMNFKISDSPYTYDISNIAGKAEVYITPAKDLKISRIEVVQISQEEVFRILTEAKETKEFEDTKNQYYSKIQMLHLLKNNYKLLYTHVELNDFSRNFLAFINPAQYPDYKVLTGEINAQLPIQYQTQKRIDELTKGINQIMGEMPDTKGSELLNFRELTENIYSSGQFTAYIESLKTLAATNIDNVTIFTPRQRSQQSLSTFDKDKAVNSYDKLNSLLNGVEINFATLNNFNHSFYQISHEIENSRAKSDKFTARYLKAIEITTPIENVDGQTVNKSMGEINNKNKTILKKEMEYNMAELNQHIEEYNRLNSSMLETYKKLHADLKSAKNPYFDTPGLESSKQQYEKTLNALISALEAIISPAKPEAEILPGNITN